MMKSQLRADAYRGKALLAVVLATTCGLPRVREKHEHAASAWLALARSEDHRSAEASRRAAAAPERRRPGEVPERS
jgi:hypothetical protein